MLKHYYVIKTVNIASWVVAIALDHKIAFFLEIQQ